MRLRSISTSSTVTITFCCTLTTSAGSLTKRSASSLTCTKPILVHADIHEGAELGDIGDDAGQLHAGLQIFHFGDMPAKANTSKSLARVAARLGQFGHDVGQRGKADRSGDIALDVDARAQTGSLHQPARSSPDPRPWHPRWVAFGMHRAGIQGVGAAGDAQKTGRLLEGLGPQARHLLSALRALKGPLVSRWATMLRASCGPRPET
jgi:hypothetical protein